MICFLRVCSGNMCRSASVENLLKHNLNTSIFEIDSAHAPIFCQGSLLDQHSIEVAYKYRTDITNQKNRSFIKKDFQIFDYIYVMDSSNYEDVINRAHSKQEEGTVSLTLNTLHPGENKSVPDPYHDSTTGFKQAYYMQEQSCIVTDSELA